MIESTGINLQPIFDLAQTLGEAMSRASHKESSVSMGSTSDLYSLVYISIL